MFDLGWTELLVIGIVALIVVGPKDLPVLFRNIGRFVGKAKGMAREFSRAMHDAADEAGVNEMAKGLKAASNPVGSAMDGVKQAAQEMANSIDPTKFDPESETGKLAAERAADAEKIRAGTAKAASARQASEQAANEAAGEASGRDAAAGGSANETAGGDGAGKTGNGAKT